MYDELKDIILIYFNTLQEDYLLSELKELLHIHNKQLKLCIEKLFEEGMISDIKNITLTSNAIQYMKSVGIEDIEINDLLSDKVSIELNRTPFSFDDIYIPKKFKL